MTWQWEDGRLHDGDFVLDVSVRGDGTVAFRGDALALRREANATGADHTVELRVGLPFAAPEHVWIPHLTPVEGNVAGDAVFRSPAVIVADAATALALIVDVDDVAAARGWRAWLDYDHRARTVTLAVGAYRATGHVFYERAPLADAVEATLRLHVVVSREAEDLADPYRMAARWIWDRWGRPRLGPPRPLAPLMAHVVRWAFSRDEGWGESVWQELGGGPAAPVFIVDVTRHPSIPRAERTWREPRSIWNQAWFSTQRCANGLYRYGRQIAAPDLEARARRMTAVALSAPQTDGLFPSVLVADDAGTWRWTGSDRRPSSVSAEACHLVDAAFTSRMLLDWCTLTKDSAAQAYVMRFVDRLLRLQRPSGALPGWVEPDGRISEELAEGPESAVSASLLFDLAEQGHGAARTAALATLPFLEAITLDARWEDFETYYSCAPWGQDLLGRKVERNGVYKQNTLSIAWCAEAFLQGWKATGEARWLELARRCASELSLYQAAWDPPWLPAPAYGGFGVMNADCEWNDARQSLFAPLLLELGRVTGDRELVERGIAAVRASFSMMYCPENAALARAYEARFPFFGPETYGFMMENQGHDPAQPIGTFTIYSWGNGSALAMAALVRERYPEVASSCGLEP